MGMFSSLFGSSGSDKADKMRQQAVDAFDAVKTPELSALQVKLNDYVNAGKITPEEAEAQMLNSNAFNSIKTDPSLTGAAKSALGALQKTGEQGGLSAIDKAQLQDITDQQTQENKSATDAIMANARARGVGNSNLTTANQLIAEQGSADRAAKSGLGVAANAQARALQALQAAGQLGQSMQGQEFGQKAEVAKSQNAIDQFNAANATDMSKFNTSNNLAAQQANLATAQHVNDLNTQTQNANKEFNANQNQTVFNDDLAKAAGKNGTLNQWAGDAQKQSQAEAGADMALTGQIIGAGATAAGGAFGGPAGAAAAGGGSTSTSPQFGKVMNASPEMMGFAHGGMVLNDKQHWEPSQDPEHISDMLVEKPEANPDAIMDLSHFTDPAKLRAKVIMSQQAQDPTAPPMDAVKPSLEDEYQEFVQKFCNGGTVNMADGGKVHIKPANMKAGGKVPGTPKVPGDSPKNDTVPAKLSPGEVVLPRSVVSQPEKVAPFVKATTGYDPIAAALRRLHQPKL